MIDYSDTHNIPKPNNKTLNSTTEQEQEQEQEQEEQEQEDTIKTNNWYNRYRFSTVQCSLLGLLAIQSIAVISILSSTVAKIQKEIQLDNPQLKTISTYLAIFIVANIFLIIMTVDLLLNKNVVQLIALCAFNVAMVAYGAILPNQIQRALHNPGGAVSWNGAREGTSCNMYLSCYGVQYLYADNRGWIIAIPVITGLVSILMGYLTWLIYKEFGWEIFKLIGADLGLKRTLQRKYLFHMLQKFAFFFFFGLSLQYLILASSMSSTERTLTICALPFSLGFIMLGGIAVTREIKWMMHVYFVCWAGASVFFIYKLVRLYDNDSISASVRSLSLFSVLTISLLFATGIVAVLCYRNFGQGLLETPAVLNQPVWSQLLRGKFFKKKSKSTTTTRTRTSAATEGGGSGEGRVNQGKTNYNHTSHQGIGHKLSGSDSGDGDQVVRMNQFSHHSSNPMVQLNHHHHHTTSNSNRMAMD